jgi:hypothetical protein
MERGGWSRFVSLSLAAGGASQAAKPRLLQLAIGPASYLPSVN